MEKTTKSEFKTNQLYDKAEELDMRLEELGSLIDVLGTYTSNEEDNNNMLLGSALDFVSWSISQLREVYSIQMISLSNERNQDNVQ